MDKSPTDKIKKTRNRVPTSCEHCRKRKLKCDRQKPCGNCVKSQTEHLCKYVVSQKSSPANLPKVNLNNEIIKLKLQINKLERILQLNNIDVSSYNNILPELSREDSNSSEENDPMISLTDKFDTMIIKENKILHAGTTSYVTLIVGDKHLSQIFEAYSKRHLLIYESYKERQKIKASDFPSDYAKNHLAWLTLNARDEVTACDLENLASSKFDILNSQTGITNMQAKLILDVIDDINKKLPPLYVVNVLIDHFFKYVYPLLPLVNEEIFRDELSYVLVPTIGGGCKVSITHLQHCSIISLLLLVLRYAYLAVNTRDYGEDNASIGNDLLVAMIKSGHVIDSSMVLSAKSLLMALPSDDSIFKKITLRNIQVLMYLRLYQVYSPEMHEEHREHSLTLALIIQMVRSLGANRDPANFPTIFKDDREITVWRRIFYKLLTLDVNNAFEYGCPLIISDNEFDVKLPSLSDKEMETLSNFRKGLLVEKTTDEIKKIVIENAINKDTVLEYESTKLIRDGLNAFQNFKFSTKRSNLLKIVNKMQEFVDYKIPSLWELLQDSKTSNQLERLFDIPKVRKFEIRLNTQNFLSGFYYLLYLNDDDEGQEGDDDECSSGSGIATGASASSGSSLGTESPANNISGIFTDSHNKYHTHHRTNSSATSQNNEQVSKTPLYKVRAVETALTILKMNFDYIKYMTQSPTLHGDTKQYKAFKLFSSKNEVFILNRIAMSFLRSFFFLCSIFLKDLCQNQLTIESLFEKFPNTLDATVALKWFNLDLGLKDDEENSIKNEFSFILFQFVKDLFFMNYSLKDGYFICWRNTMIIKLFINYFKSSDKTTCSDYLHPPLTKKKGSLSSERSAPYREPLNTDSSTDSPVLNYSQLNEENNTSIHNTNIFTSLGHNNGDSNSEGMPAIEDENDIDNSVFDNNDVNINNKLMDEFLDSVVPEANSLNFENTGNDLDALIYEDIDLMLDDMFQDSGEREKQQVDVELFKTAEYGAYDELLDTGVKNLNHHKKKFEKFVNNFGNQSSAAQSHNNNNSNKSDHNSISSSSTFSHPHRIPSINSSASVAFTEISNTSEGSSAKTPDMHGFNPSIDFSKANKLDDDKKMNEILGVFENTEMFYR